MIKLQNKQFNIDIKQVIELLRAEIKLKYERDIFRDIKTTGNDIMVTCPYHKNGQERKPSMGINTDTGVFHCFTCGESGSIDLLISNCLGVFDHGEKGIEWLSEHFSEDIYHTRSGLDIIERKKINLKKYISEEELDSYRYYHAYMWKRHLTPELVEFFDIGYDESTKCITIPVNDISGNCLFIARRSVKGKFFNYPTNVEKPVWALDKCINEKTIIVCESIFNATSCWKYGKPAVALLGTGSREQLEILRHAGKRKIILALDGDKAGDRGRDKLIKGLKDYAQVSYLKTPRDGRDINDLTKEEFLELEEVIV